MHYFVVIVPTVLYCAYIAFALAIEYKKNDEKQENLDNTQIRKTKKDLDRKFNESDEDLVNIIIDLEPSIEGVSNLGIKFAAQVTSKVSEIDLSNQQEFEQTPEIKDSFTEAIRLKGNFVPNLSLI